MQKNAKVPRFAQGYSKATSEQATQDIFYISPDLRDHLKVTMQRQL